MSKKIVLLVAAIALIAVSTKSMGTLFGRLFGPKIETIETDLIAQMLRERGEAEAEAKISGTEIPPASFVVVDVRSDAEVNVSIIPGAITKEQFEKNRDQYSGRLVIPYCTIGVRSGAYAKRLAKDNLHVKNYKGSILKWVDAGLPLETLEGMPTNRVHTYSNYYRVSANYEKVVR